MRKIVLIFLSVISLAQFSKVGTAGAQFLKISFDPKGISMGSAYTAVAKDISGIYWNPAALALSENTEIMVSDVEWFAGIRNNFIGYKMPKTLKGVIGLSISAFTSTPEPITTEEQPEGTGEEWHYTAISCIFSYAKMMTDKLAFGINGKYLQERIWDIASQGFSIDLGFNFYPQYWKSLKFGFVIKDFGTMMKFTGGHTEQKWINKGTPSGVAPTDVGLISSPYPLPLCFKIGAMYNIIEKPTTKLTIAMDFSHPNDGTEKLHTGIEYSFIEMFFIRLGYTLDEDVLDAIGEDKESKEWYGDEKSSKGLSAGIGVNSKVGGMPLSINYAVQDMGLLGLRHRYSLQITY